MISVHYQLIDTLDNYKEFNNMAEVIKWAEGIGEDMFVYLHVERPFLELSSYHALMNYAEFLTSASKAIMNGGLIHGKA